MIESLPKASVMKSLIQQPENIHSFTPKYHKLSEAEKKLVRPTEEQLNIRKMSVEDVPQVFDIERESFNDSSWTIDAFYHEIEQNQFATYFVIEYDDKIIDI